MCWGQLDIFKLCQFLECKLRSHSGKYKWKYFVLLNVLLAEGLSLGMLTKAWAWKTTKGRFTLRLLSQVIGSVQFQPNLLGCDVGLFRLLWVLVSVLQMHRGATTELCVSEYVAKAGNQIFVPQLGSSGFKALKNLACDGRLWPITWLYKELALLCLSVWKPDSIVDNPAAKVVFQHCQHLPKLQNKLKTEAGRLQGFGSSAVLRNVSVICRLCTVKN